MASYGINIDLTPAQIKKLKTSGIKKVKAWLELQANKSVKAKIVKLKKK
jgi:hypothetical protein